MFPAAAELGVGLSQNPWLGVILFSMHDCLNSKAQLCLKLEQAAVKLDALGDRPIWSYYDSGPAMAQLIRSFIIKIEEDSISGAEIAELWFIFAPFCDWDGTVGDADMGVDIFLLIELVFPRNQTD